MEVAAHTAVDVGHKAVVAVAEVAVRTVAVAHTGHTAATLAVAADVAVAVADADSSQAGSSFALGCNYLHHLFHLQSFP